MYGQDPASQLRGFRVLGILKLGHPSAMDGRVKMNRASIFYAIIDIINCLAM